MTRTELIQAVRDIAARLEKPLSPEESAAGWTEKSCADTLRFFRKLEIDLSNGADIPYVSIGRALDGFGIDGGQLLEDACRISVALNEREW